MPLTTAALPPPIEWEPCGPDSGFASGCRRMKVDWPFVTVGRPFGTTPAVDVDANGNAVLDIVRFSDAWIMRVVAEADGKVLNAMVDPREFSVVKQGCSFAQAVIRAAGQGYDIFQVAKGELGTSPHAAAGGPHGALHPQVLHVWPEAGDHDFSAAGQVWASVTTGEIGAAKWGEPWQVIATSAQVGLEIHQPRPWNDFVPFDASNGVVAGIVAWTPANGTYDFITFQGDTSQGAMSLGTDGVDMVWFQGAGKGSGFLEPYPDRSVMVSPYTTDPAMLVPKRLRSYPSPNYPLTNWIVGCGYAAINPEDNHVLIVRLSDGWSWELSAPEPVKDYWFTTVYGLTCDEVFLRCGPVEMNIARVKLDALGPGMPPD